VVEAQEPADALAADDRSGRSIGGRLDEPPLEALVVPLGVVVGDVFSDGCAEMVLAQQHELFEALALAGTDEALGIGVQIGTASRQADRDDAGGGEEGPDLGRVERVAIKEQEALTREKAVHDVEEVPGDLQRPSTMRLADDASDLDAARLERDYEQDVKAG
jgi:hypothetical protein